MRVLIAGAGSIGRRLLADMMSTGSNELAVVDVDEERCKSLADEYDALVINGDATDPDILEKAQVKAADALVAATGSDAINTVIAMLGHRLGVQRIVVKLTTHALRGALEEIGVTDIVAPTIAAAAEIDAALHEARGKSLAQLAQAGLQLVELTVGAAVDGNRVADLGLPDGVLAVAILHEDAGRLANPDTEVAEGDVLLAVAESDDLVEKARRRVQRPGR